MRLFIKNLFSKPNVKNQILRIFLLAGIIPILLFGIFSILYVQNQMDQHYRSLVKADGLRINSVLFDITTTIYSSSETLTDNSICQNLFGQQSSLSDANLASLKNIDSTIHTYRENTAAISMIHLYTNNPNISDTDYISYLPNYDDMEWHTAIGDHWGTWTCLTNEDIHGNTFQELSLVRRIGIVSNKYTAYLVIHLDNNYLRNRIKQSDNQIAISVDDTTLFYSSDTSLLLTQMIVPDDFDGSFYKYTGPVSMQNQDVLTNIVTFRPYKTDNLFFIQTCNTSAYHSINQMLILYTIIIMIAIIVPCLLVHWFSSYFSARVTALKSAMHQTRLGDYNILDQFKGDDELSATFDDLKATVELIHEKEACFYQAQIKEQQLVNRQQQMEFEMLASQINPHFLYNTLETIRMQALTKGNRDVATSIKLLGKSMHYVLENTGTSSNTLTKELEYIRTYLAIQQLRFGDRVNAVFEIEETLDTDSCKILPLLLQPIVENAIIHGLENINEHGSIQIAVHTQDENLYITITDNGIGMDAASLEMLNQRILKRDPNDTRSIGLYNINQRIKLFYGTDYSMKIISNMEQGTSVTLKLPRTLNRMDDQTKTTKHQD